jgi:F-type H+-transporting ATPase subunit a
VGRIGSLEIMRGFRAIWLVVLLAGFVLRGVAAEPHPEAGAAAPHPAAHAGAPAQGGHGGHEAAGVSAKAPELLKIGPLLLTNSMVYTWIIALLIFVVARLATRKMQDVPSGLQNGIEAVVEGLENLTQGLLEAKVARWVFPVVATFFLFILVSNLMGLLPGVGSIGGGERDPNSSWPLALKHVESPLLRPPTADANTTGAMAAIFFVMCTVWAIRYNGAWGLVKHIFGVKGGMTGWIVVPLTLVFLFIGLIEILSICIRPVALAMRLYGNIYGGESVLSTMLHMPPLGLPALPFYFLELLVAVVQTLVFSLLCIAFAGSLCSHTEDAPHEPHSH